jgi:hypothetical protein
MEKIHSKIITDLFATLKENSNLIIELATSLLTREGTPALFEDVPYLKANNASPLTLSHQIIPIDLAQKIIEGDISKVFTKFEHQP